MHKNTMLNILKLILQSSYPKSYVHLQNENFKISLKKVEKYIYITIYLEKLKEDEFHV